MTRTIYIIICSICIVSLCACKRRGDKVLSDKEMVQYMADVALAEAQNQAGNPAKLPEEMRMHLEESVMASRGISKEEMDSTLAWYGRNLDQYWLLFDKVDKEIMRRQKKLNGKPTTIIEKDNIWPYAQNAWFSTISPSQGLTFSIPAESLDKGESLNWKMRFNNSANLKATFGVDYADNTSSIVSSSTYGQRQLDIELLTDTARKVRRIFGTIYIPKENLPLWADSISITKAPFDSLTYYKYNNQKFVKTY